jgi:hypothetical protein
VGADVIDHRSAGPFDLTAVPPADWRLAITDDATPANRAEIRFAADDFGAPAAATAREVRRVLARELHVNAVQGASPIARSELSLHLDRAVTSGSVGAIAAGGDLDEAARTALFSARGRRASHSVEAGERFVYLRIANTGTIDLSGVEWRIFGLSEPDAEITVSDPAELAHGTIDVSRRTSVVVRAPWTATARRWLLAAVVAHARLPAPAFVGTAHPDLQALHERCRRDRALAYRTITVR